MGSSTSLERTEWDCDVDHKTCDNHKECEKTHTKSRDHDCEVERGRPREKNGHCNHATGCNHSVAVKHGWSDEYGDPLEHQCSKEW